MRRGSALLVFAAACSTSSAAPSSPDAGRAAPVATAHDAAEQRLVRVTAFDCEKKEEFPGLPAQKGPVTSTSGIRSWHGGGPGGANWNVGDLRCVVRVETSCDHGHVDVILRVGKVVVAERKADVARTVDVEVSVALKAWKQNLDDVKKKGVTDLPYRTAVFRALAAVDCSAPRQANLKLSGYRDVTDEDVFVAGFASGE
jgi:hypothetical protein